MGRLLPPESFTGLIPAQGRKILEESSKNDFSVFTNEFQLSK